VSDKEGEHLRVHPLARFFRLLFAVSAFGMATGGMILVGAGIFEIAEGLLGMVRHAADGAVSSRIMKSTDELLFGTVLVIFAANIFFGFCIDESKALAWRIPAFMSAHTMSELKATFCHVIVVYLIVDFATDVAAGGAKLDARLLYFPATIVLIALALRLMPHAAAHEGAKGGHGERHDSR